MPKRSHHLPSFTGRLLMLVLAAASAPSAAACGPAAQTPPATVPGDGGLAGTVTASPAGSGAPVAVPAPPGASRLEAVRVVTQFCRLVDRGRPAAAEQLCSRGARWSRAQARALLAFHFRSARIVAAPDARTLTLVARVWVIGARDSPLPDGLARLSITLGRIPATGGWRITAIETKPGKQPVKRPA